ncbi:hypothetical protein JXA47_07300 [Candidatus Sumerlaeota bacterium]|nr:hypothetical protein [Candidatus Sumerlaeota bacterium]
MAPETYSGHLGDMLLREGLVTNEALEEALRRQRETGQPLGRVLVEMHAITEQVKLNFFHKHFGHDVVSLRDHEIPDILYTYLTRSTAMKFRVIPYKLEGDTLVVAMEDPSDLVILDNLKAQVGLRIRPVIASFTDIEAALETYPGGDEDEEVIWEEPPSFATRLIKYTFFPALAFTPLATVIILMIFSDGFQYILLHPPMGMDTVDFVLSITLIWGLWALFAYELDGILVNPEHRD